MKTAFLAFDGCAVWQVALLQKLLQRNQWAMRTLTLDGIAVHTDGGLGLIPDGAIETASPRDYNLVLIAGGPVQSDVMTDHRLHRFLRQYDGFRGYLAVAGEAIAYIADAGLLGGLRFTTTKQFHTKNETLFHGGFYVEEPVCFDGNLISSDGSDVSEFAQAVLTLLGLTGEFEIGNDDTGGTKS